MCQALYLHGDVMFVRKRLSTNMLTCTDVVPISSSPQLPSTLKIIEIIDPTQHLNKWAKSILDKETELPHLRRIVLWSDPGLPPEASEVIVASRMRKLISFLTRSLLRICGSDDDYKTDNTLDIEPESRG